MTLYTPQHYENKLLLAEKTTIEKALKRENGSIKKAYNLLCPNFTQLNRILLKYQKIYVINWEKSKVED